CLQASYWPWTF
nr:immunoglobulin light chain junction region [Macaca mulatta]